MKTIVTKSLGSFFAVLVLLLPPAVWAEGGQMSDDGFSITPELMTGTTKSAPDGNASTVGLSYSFGKSIANKSPEEQLAQCRVGTSTQIPEGGCENTLSTFNAGVSATGKLAADSNVNVGNAINFAGTAGYEFYKLDSVPSSLATGTGKINIKIGYEANPNQATRNYTYGISTYGYYSPSGAPSWMNFPSGLLEFERVNPAADKARKSVDATLSNFSRGHIRISAGLKFPDVVQGRDLKLDFKFDHWREVNPSSAIVAAGLDRQTFRAASVTFPGTGKDPDWQITYASGNVPANQASAKVWQLGWNWKFNKPQ